MRVAIVYRRTDGANVNFGRADRSMGGPGGTGPATSSPSGFRQGMRAMRHRDFRIFFVGAIISNSGSWLQNLAVPYVLFELTGKAVWVGLAGFAQFIPSFLLAPIGGALADNNDRRKVLLITQTAMAIAAFMLWAVWVLGWHQPALILGIVALTGIFNGLNIPSWQAFVPALVPREDLASAITLNSTQFNAARAIGPALAGVLLAVAGPSWAFFLNGLSFVAVLGALAMIKPRPNTTPPAGKRQSIAAGFGEVVRYINRRTGIRISIICAMLVAFFGNPVTQFTVVFVSDVYHAGPRVLGVLAAAVGVGAVLIAPMLSIWDSTVSRATLVRWALPAYALAVIAFGLAPVWPLGLLALLAVGAGFLVVIATTNTAVQMIVADEMRGRVMSVRVMGFMLSFPLGSLVQGALGDLIGPQVTVVLSGSILLLLAIWLWSRPGLLDHLDAVDDTPDS